MKSWQLFHWQTLSRLNGSWSCISWTRCKTRRFSPMRPLGIWGKRFQVHFFKSWNFSWDLLNDQSLLKNAPTQLRFYVFFFACLRSSQLLQCELVPKDLQWAVSANWGFVLGWMTGISSNFPTFRLGTQHRALCQFERERDQVGRCVGIKWKKNTQKQHIKAHGWLFCRVNLVGTKFTVPGFHHLRDLMSLRGKISFLTQQP